MPSPRCRTSRLGGGTARTPCLAAKGWAQREHRVRRYSPSNMLLTSPLVGRAAELEALRLAVDRLEAGGGGVVVLEGEPGIGKSRLAAEALADASGREVRTLLGRCSELEADLPFAPVGDALRLGTPDADSDQAALQALLQAERSPGLSEGEHRIRLLHALAE